MRITQTLLVSLSLSPALVFSWGGNQQSKPTTCGCTPHPERVEIKHIESKGIGYNQGYTTIEGFFIIPSTLENNWVPFLDVRAHLFNDGLPAVNAGIGLRHLRSRVWGANLYYDYRKTSHFHYNQVSAGLETLGEIWDFRINGYFPVGKKDHSYHYKFDKFEGNSIILKNRKEFAMTGGNAEVGVHAYNSKNLDLYAAAGPYYFTRGHSAWGGEGRLALTIVDCVRLQLSGSYDNVFKGIVQGEIGLFYTWGGKKVVKKRKCHDCCHSRMIIDRALQRVDRQEIIVADHKRETSVAIDPATGNPYTVWFVNNLSHSLGTIESPFNTLVAAQNASNANDIIYVFPGDGTDTGMNAGIILKNGQQFLGAGINQKIKTTHGTITIPGQASSSPVVSNTNDPTGLGVQLAAGNNIVSGFYLQDTQGTQIGSLTTGALTIVGGSGYTIKKNIVSTQGEGAGINIYGGGNNTVISNNLFIGTDSGGSVDEGVLISQAPGLPPIGGTIIITRNLFTGASPTTALAVGVDCEPSFFAPTSLPSLVLEVSNNSMNIAGTINALNGIFIDNVSGGPSTLTCAINGNQIILPNNSAAIGVQIIEDTGSIGPLIANLANNLVQPSPPETGYSFANETGNPAMLQVNFDTSNIGTRVGP